MKTLRFALTALLAASVALSAAPAAADTAAGKEAKSAPAASPSPTPPAEDKNAHKPPSDAEVMAMAEKAGAVLTRGGAVQSSTKLKEVVIDAATTDAMLTDAEKAMPVGAPEEVVTTRGAGANVYIFIKPENVKDLGHIGWGYFAPNQGYFIGGSTENYRAWLAILPGYDNQFWAAGFNTEAEMFAAFRRKGYSGYKRKWVSSANPNLAWSRAMHTKNSGFSGVGWNCLDHTYYILEGFGTRDMPWKQTNPAPNGWFNAFPGTGYRLP